MKHLHCKSERFSTLFSTHGNILTLFDLLLFIQIVLALEKVDRILGMLMDGLKVRNLHKCANIIIASDHGEVNTHFHFTCHVTAFLYKTIPLSTYCSNQRRYQLMIPV